MFGWKILFMNPILGDLYGYWSGSSTWIFHTPPAKGATYNDTHSVCTPFTCGDRWDEGRTFGGPVEPDVELLHAVVHEVDLIVRHEPGDGRVLL